MDNILSLDELKTRISSYYTEKKASDMPSEQDPQETTPPDFVKDDGDDASKMVVPPEAVSATNTDGSAENNIPGQGKNDGNKGEASGKAPGKSETTDVTADKTQQKKDESVDDPVTAKVAQQGLSLAERIKARLMGKQATDATVGQSESDAVEQHGTEVDVPQQQQKSAEQVASDFDLEPDAYRKIAHLVLGYQEGREMLDALADKELGKQAAEQLISEAEELGAHEAQVAQQQAEMSEYVQKIASTATQADVNSMEKMAAVHTKAINSFEYDFEKQAYDAGAEAAAAAADEGDGMIPGNDGEDISIEEIAEIVMAMVESGELDPQLAEAILAELAGAGGGMEGGMPPGAEGGMPPEAMMGGGEVPPELAEEMKMASAEIEKAASWLDDPRLYGETQTGEQQNG